MTTRFSLITTALLGVATLTTQAQQLNTAKLDSLLTALATNNKMMGSLALSHDGQVLYSRAFGYAQLAPKVPATAATRYRIGSISKMFTTVLILQLVEEKKLTLSTPLARFFPRVPNAKTITIDQLLSHHSGLHNFTNNPDYEGYMTQPKTEAEMVAIIAAAKPDFEPGAKGEYSNSNFVLLGYVVEKLTKMTYAQALQKRITTKIGLKSTYYGGKIDPAKQEALSYETNAGSWKLSPETDMSIPGGAGALVSTPTDLDRFLEALFGGKLLSASSLSTMQTLTDKYGRGLFVVPFYTKKGYGHTGGIDGFRSSSAYFPEDKLAIALTSNAVEFPTNDVMIGALSAYFGRPYKVPDFTASTFVPAPADLDRYVGTYASPLLPLKITMTKQGNTLRSQATGQGAFALEPVRQGVFKFDQAHLQIEFDAASPSFTLKQGGGTFVFTKE